MTNKLKKDDIETIDKPKPKTFTRQKAVSLPVWKIPENTPIFVRFLEQIKVKDDIDQKTGETKRDQNGKPKTISIAHVENAETGDECEIVVGVLLQKKLEEMGTNEKGELLYVGNTFEISKRSVEGVRWKLYEVWQVSVD